MQTHPLSLSLSQNLNVPSLATATSPFVMPLLRPAAPWGHPPTAWDWHSLPTLTECPMCAQHRTRPRGQGRAPRSNWEDPYGCGLWELLPPPHTHTISRLVDTYFLWAQSGRGGSSPSPGQAGSDTCQGVPVCQHTGGHEPCPRSCPSDTALPLSPGREEKGQCAFRPGQVWAVTTVAIYEAPTGWQAVYSVLCAPGICKSPIPGQESLITTCPGSIQLLHEGQWLT